MKRFPKLFVARPTDPRTLRLSTGGELCCPLVAVDGSPASDQAMFIAGLAAEKWDGTVTVLSVPQLSYWNTGDVFDPTLQAHLEDAAQDALVLALAILPAGVRANSMLRQGPLGPEVLRCALASESDLIILGINDLGLNAARLRLAARYLRRRSPVPFVEAHGL